MASADHKKASRSSVIRAKAELLINADVFRNEFGGKYILSRAKLSNAADLGFDFVGKWDSVEGVYTMYVYEMK
jgi:hypothetical protein